MSNDEAPCEACIIALGLVHCKGYRDISNSKVSAMQKHPKPDPTHSLPHRCDTLCALNINSTEIWNAVFIV